MFASTSACITHCSLWLWAKNFRRIKQVLFLEEVAIIPVPLSERSPQRYCCRRVLMVNMKNRARSKKQPCLTYTIWIENPQWDCPQEKRESFPPYIRSVSKHDPSDGAALPCRRLPQAKLFIRIQITCDDTRWNWESTPLTLPTWTVSLSC